MPGRELSTRCTVDSGLRQGWGPRGHQLGGQGHASRSRALCPTSSASESAARPGGRGRVLGGAAVTRPASSQRLAGPWPWAPVAVPGPFTKHRRAAGHGAWSSEQRAEALHVHARTHAHANTHMETCAHVGRALIHARVHMYMCGHARVDVSTYVDMCASVGHVCMCAHTRTHAKTCTYVCEHTQTCRDVCAHGTCVCIHGCCKCTRVGTCTHTNAYGDARTHEMCTHTWIVQMHPRGHAHTLTPPSRQPSPSPSLPKVTPDPLDINELLM